MKTILHGLSVLIRSGLLLKPATLVGIGIGYWIMFLLDETIDSYSIVKTEIPYLIMGCLAINLALISNKSRLYDKLNYKCLLENILANFFISFISFFTFIAFVNFISF